MTTVFTSSTVHVPTIPEVPLVYDDIENDLMEDIENDLMEDIEEDTNRKETRRDISPGPTARDGDGFIQIGRYGKPVRKQHGKYNRGYNFKQNRTRLNNTIAWKGQQQRQPSNRPFNRQIFSENLKRPEQWGVFINMESEEFRRAVVKAKENTNATRIYEDLLKINAIVECTKSIYKQSQRLILRKIYVFLDHEFSQYDQENFNYWKRSLYSMTNRQLAFGGITPSIIIIDPFDKSVIAKYKRNEKGAVFNGGRDWDTKRGTRSLMNEVIGCELDNLCNIGCDRIPNYFDHVYVIGYNDQMKTDISKTKEKGYMVFSYTS
jgi:hypothetical protein